MAVCASAHKMCRNVRNPHRIVSQQHPKKMSRGGTETVFYKEAKPEENLLSVFMQPKAKSFIYAP